MTEARTDSTPDKRDGALLTASLPASAMADVDALAHDAGISRSEAIRRLCGSGLESLVEAGWDAGSGEAFQGAAATLAARASARVAMLDGTEPRLSRRLVAEEALPKVATSLGADPAWLSAAPAEVTNGMAGSVDAAVRSSGTTELSLSQLRSLALSLASGDDPWFASVATRERLIARQDARIAALLPAAHSGLATPAMWAELAWRSCARMALPVCDVLGVPAEGPARVLAWLCEYAGDDPLVSKTAACLAGELTNAGASPAAAARAARLALNSGLLSDDPKLPSESVRSSALVLAGCARALAGHADSESKARLRRAALLADDAARGALDYVQSFGCATAPEVADALGVSAATARKRLADLASEGLVERGGEGGSVLWLRPGYVPTAEDLLTPRQRQVLTELRKRGGAKTADVARACSISGNHATNTLTALERFGLVTRGPKVGDWLAVPTALAAPATPNASNPATSSTSPNPSSQSAKQLSSSAAAQDTSSAFPSASDESTPSPSSRPSERSERVERPTAEGETLAVPDVAHQVTPAEVAKAKARHRAKKPTPSTPYTAAERQHRELAHLSDHPRATTADLADMLGSSRTTILRDLRALQDAGCLQQRGGRKDPLWVIVNPADANAAAEGYKGIANTAESSTAAPAEAEGEAKQADLLPRQRDLLNLLRTNGPTPVRPLAEQLGVVGQTVRRDLKHLATLGLVQEAGTVDGKPAWTLADDDAK